MAKNNDSGKFIFGSVVVLAVVLLILGYLYYTPIVNFLNSLTHPSAGSVFGSNPQGSLPAQQNLQCTNYNIALEFIKYFGAANMQTMAQSCINAGGTWVAVNNQVSCHFPNTINFDCNQPTLNYVEALCNQMNANYVCSNTTKFIGCLCNVNAPTAPSGGNGNQGGEEYTCAWQEYTWGGQCGGTCPQGKTCERISGSTCACVSEAQEVGGVGTVFVSSLKWSGAMGRLAGADAKCQVSAQSAGLSGTWKAIMSDSTTSAFSRLPDQPYYNMDGLLLANNKADLFDGTIANFVNRDEYRNAVSDSHVWTGTNEKGDALGDIGITCHDWQWVSDGLFGRIGSSGSNAVAWLSNTVVDECKVANRIYCARVS